MKTRLSILTFFLCGGFYANASGLRIFLSNEHCSAVTELRFAEHAHSGFDKGLDKEMRKLPGNALNYIYSLGSESQMLSLNFCPEPNAYHAVPLQVSVAQAGTFSFCIEEDTTLNIQYALTDVSKGETIFIYPGMDKELSFTDSEKGSVHNYILHIFPAPSTISSPVSCADRKDGSVRISCSDPGNWDARMQIGNKMVSKTTSNSNDVVFDKLAAGVYVVGIWKGDYKIADEIVTVGRPAPVISKFTLVKDSAYAGQTVFANNRSSGGDRWLWDFGDNSTSKEFQAAHTYLKAGQYTINLITADAAGCISSSTQLIYILPEDSPFTSSLR